MGRHGSALVFLFPSEMAYIQYMDISQHVTLLPLREAASKELASHKSSVVERAMELLCKER